MSTNMGAFDFKINLDSKSATKDLKNLDKMVTKVDKELVRERALGLDTKKAETSLDKLSKQMDKIGKQTVKLDIDDSKLNSLLNNIKEVTMVVKADISQAMASVKGLLGMMDNQSIKINADTSSATSAIKQLKNQLSDQTIKVNATTSNDGNGGSNAGGIIAGTGSVLSGGAVVGLVQGQQEKNLDFGQLKTNASMSGTSQKQLNDWFKQARSIVPEDDTVTEALNQLMQIKTDDKTRSKLLKYAMGAKIKYGDSVSLEGVLEAIQESTKPGQQLQGQFADVVNWDGGNQDVYNDRLKKTKNDPTKIANLLNDTVDNSDEQARYDLYLKQNDAILKQAEANAQLSQSMATLAQQLAPMVTGLTTFLNKIIDSVTAIKGLAQALGVLAVFASVVTIFSLIGTAISWVVTKIIVVIRWIKNCELIMAGIETVMGIIGSVSAGVIALIIAAIVAVIGIVIYWKTVLLSLESAFYKVGSFGVTLAEGMLSNFNTIINGAVWLYNKIVSIFGKSDKVINNAYQGEIEKLKAKMEAQKSHLDNKASQKWDDAKSAAANTTKAIKDKFTFKKSKPSKTATNFVKGLNLSKYQSIANTNYNKNSNNATNYLKRMNKKADDVAKKLKNATSKATKSIKKATTAKKTGKHKSNNHKNTIKNNVKKSSSSATNTVQNAIKSLTDTIQSQIKSFKSSIGVFDRYTRTVTSVGRLMSNQRTRLNAYTKWSSVKTKLLNDKNLSRNTKGEISDMGVDKLSELQALSRMTGKQKRSYSNMIDQINKRAEKQAKNTVYIDKLVASDTTAKTIATSVIKELKRRGVKVN